MDPKAEAMMDMSPYCAMGNNPILYSDPLGDFITWSLGNGGFSIGFNLTPIGIPLGAGINVGFGNGGSIGGYGEVGYRVGGTGATINQSYNYGFKSGWSSSTTAGVYASYGGFNVGASYGTSGRGVSAGFGFGNDASGFGFNIGYGSGGWSYGIGGYYHDPEQVSANIDPEKVVKKSKPGEIAEGDIVDFHEAGSPLSLWAQQSKPGLNEVEIHAHGSQNTINGISSPKEIGDQLYGVSPSWRKMVDNGTKITLKIYSCNTGKGNINIASKIKSVYPNVTVVAPTNQWVVRYNVSFFGKRISLIDGYIKNPGTWKKF